MPIRLAAALALRQSHSVHQPVPVHRSVRLLAHRLFAIALLSFALRRFVCVPQLFERVHLLDAHLLELVLRSEHVHLQYAPADLRRFDVVHLQYAPAVLRRVRPNTLVWPANYPGIADVANPVEFDFALGTVR